MPGNDSSPVLQRAAPWRLLARAVATAVALAAAPLAVAGDAPPGDHLQQPQDPPAASTTAAQEPQQAKEPAPSSPATKLRGSLATRYWLRWTSNDTDQDVFSTLSADYGDEQKDAVTGRFVGRLALDIDGYDETFGSINDSYGSRQDALLYDLYADFHRVDGFEKVRVGRQSIWETPEFVYFDGAHAVSEEIGTTKLQFGAYGGASTHLYEASNDGDWTAGVYSQARPWKGGRLRLDYLYLEDEARLGHENDLLAAGWWQTLAENLLADVQYSRLEDEDRDVRVRGSWRHAPSDFFVQASWYKLLTTQGDLVLELDPYYGSLLELKPYHQTSLSAAKGIGDHLRLTAGTDLRRVSDDADVGTNNRDYDRYYFTVAVIDLPVEGLTAGVTADLWDSDGRTVDTWGADLTYQVSADTSASVGSYYSAWKYDIVSEEERDDVRTWFVRGRHKLSRRTTLDLGYELEDNDIDDFHFLRMGATWRF
ncbi:MAG: hypothetical protein RL148_1425 [Planctomycetota bacterium]